MARHLFSLEGAEPLFQGNGFMPKLPHQNVFESVEELEANKPPPPMRRRKMRGWEVSVPGLGKRYLWARSRKEAIQKVMTRSVPARVVIPLVNHVPPHKLLSQMDTLGSEERQRVKSSILLKGTNGEA